MQKAKDIAQCSVRVAYYLNLCKSDGEPSLLAMSRALHVLSSCVLCRPPMICLKVLVGVCVRGSGLTPDKKEARVDLGSGSDASAALAALGGGPALQSSSITCLLYTYDAADE